MLVQKVVLLVLLNGFGLKYTETIGSAHTELSTQHKLEVEANKIYIKTLIDITLYLSCQGLPFRGHDESTASLNKGRYNIFYIVGIK